LEIKVRKIITYDLVSEPGFKGAQLVSDHMLEKLRKERLRKERKEKLDIINQINEKTLKYS